MKNESKKTATEEWEDIPLHTGRKNRNMRVTPKHKSKSKLKPGSERSLQPSLTLDYSDTYRENEVLQEDLHEHIGNIQKDEKRTMEEKSEQLEEIRKQVEVITRLQEAVKTKNQLDSADIISSGRATRYGRGRSAYAAGRGDKQEMDFFELAKASRSEQRIAAEREKFSAKNLFNQRRNHTSLGFESVNSKKFFPTTVLQDPLDFEVGDDPGDLSQNQQNHAPAHTQTHSAHASVSSKEGLKLAMKKRRKGYLEGTMSSQGGRPMTAAPVYHREEKKDDLLPPRAKSASNRSRSRRELEILSRLVPDEDAIETAKLDALTEWEIFYEKRRRKKLQLLREEGQVIQGKVNTFLSDISKYSTKPKPTASIHQFSERRPSIARATTNIISNDKDEVF